MMKKIIVMLLGVLLFSMVGVAQNRIVSVDTAAVGVPSDVTLLQMQQEHDKAMAYIPLNDAKTTLIPVVAIVCGTVVPALVVFFVVFLGLKYRSRVKLARYDLMAKALESGKELPDYFFEESDSRPDAGKSRLSRGFTLVGIGVGMLIFGIVISSKYVWAFSAIPLLIGIGQLLVYRMERPSAEKEPEQEI